MQRQRGEHSTIVAYTAWPLLIIPLTYFIFHEIAKVLFTDNITMRTIFMIMVNMLMIFGNISIYTPATFFLMRTWQGKSMLTSIVFPAILLIFFWLILLISSIYLVVKETDVRKKIIFGVMPLVVVAGFLFLITKKLYVKVSGIENADTYYRILWIISMYVTITYAFTKHIAILNGTVKNVLRLVLQLWLLQSRVHLYMQMNIYI